MFISLFFAMQITLAAPTKWQVDEDTGDALFLLKRGYPQIESVVEDLLHKYSAQDYLYVGIGSSPTPFSAFFKVHYPEVDFLDIPMQGLNSIAQIYTDKIAKRLEEFLQPSVLKNKKGVVVIDYVYTGTSLRIAEQYIKKILGENYHVQGYGLFFRDWHKEYFANEFSIDGYNLTGTWLGRHLVERNYVRWAPYKSIHVRDGDVENNSLYRILLQQMYFYQRQQNKKMITTHFACHVLF